MRPFSLAPLLLVALLLAWTPSSARSQGNCCLDAPSSQDCNVLWFAADSIAACPGGDSLLFSHSSLHPHASRLRVFVHYEDNSCNPRVGVPPESVFVYHSVISGNLKLNDKGPKVYADDSTDANGDTRITLPSFSGCGTIGLTLVVSDKVIGIQRPVVRTTDTNADDRTTSADLVSVCNINYTGSADAGDTSLVNAHVDHWRRNVLHGTLVQRTNLEDYPESPHLGASVNFWSPNGRWLAFTIGETLPDSSGCYRAGHSCSAVILAADPKDGNSFKRLTWQDTTGTYLTYPFCPPFHDYDPDWSPLGNEIVFDRDDWKVFRKGIPGVAGVTDTSLHLVTESGVQDQGDDGPSISPNGQWVAFARWDTTLRAFNLWKVPIGGGTATRLTETPDFYTDFYPRWSPDGNWILFDRRYPASLDHRELHGIFKVAAASTDTGTRVYGPIEPSGGGDTLTAVTPAWSPDDPDGLVITGAIGKRISKGPDSSKVVSMNVYTFDPALSPSGMKPIGNYLEPDLTINTYDIDPRPSPVLSPDGTRLMTSTNQVWAARRNMSLPPQFTSVTSTNEGTRSVADTAATEKFIVVVDELSTITVLASDPESDALTYHAAFWELQEWMAWDAPSRTLTLVSPPGSAEGYYYVKFWVTTANGGTDALIARIQVAYGLEAMSSGVEEASDAKKAPDGPNPTRGRFALTAPFVRGAPAVLTVFDIAGRKVSVIRGSSGSQLVWDGKNRRGTRVEPGIYLYFMQVGKFRRDGKVVVLR